MVFKKNTLRELINEALPSRKEIKKCLIVVGVIFVIICAFGFYESDVFGAIRVFNAIGTWE